MDEKMLIKTSYLKLGDSVSVVHSFQEDRKNQLFLKFALKLNLDTLK